MAGETLSPLLIQTYDRKLHGVPQRGSVLKDTVRMESGLTTMTHHFPATGKAIARTRAALEPVQASPTLKARAATTFELREHFEFLADHEAAQTNVSVAARYGMNSNNAVERACDQWIINALTNVNSDAIGQPISAITGFSFTQRESTADPNLAAPNAKVLTTSITGGIKDIGRAYAQLLNRAVSSADGVTIAYSELQFEGIVQITQLISRDYSPRGFIASGNVPPIYGMQWRGIESRAEGQTAGLGMVATQAFMYAREGVGLAIGTINRQRRIDWRTDLLAYQIGARILGNATAIDKNMIVPITAVNP